eukprot:XP_011452811.1 PREDICTED: perlucin-like protein [Crassostrea gigas]
MLRIYLLSIFSLTGVLAQSSCPHGWLKNDNSCYLFVTHVDNDWTESEYFCHMIGSKLVEIETEKENNFLKNHARSEHQHAKSGFWIGGTDAVVEGEWIWITSQAKFSYDDWADDFPDDYEGNEDCAHLWSGVNYSWNDSNCDERMNFICEKPLDEMLIIGRK